MINLIASQLLLCFFFIAGVSSATDTITANQSLSGDHTLVSLDGNFEMGFFRPGNSSNYYIGIWYKKVQEKTIVWVANRETPISDRFSSNLKIIDGNLVLLDEPNKQIWSTNMSSTETPASVVLLDNGNLVLRYGSSSSPPTWQSFDHPTHTLLPGMKLLYDKRANRKYVISSWKSIDDPAVGLFSLEVDQDNKQFVLSWNRSVKYWTSGPWNDQAHTFNLIPEIMLIHNFSYIDNENESYFTFSVYNPSLMSRLTLDVSGQIKQLSLLRSYGQWNVFWYQPKTLCEVYGVCGMFGVCTEQQGLPLCKCLTDSEPRLQSDWNLGDFSGGCMRNTEFDCKIKKPMLILGYVEARYLSTFLENEGQQLDESACRSSCVNNCFCFAYTFISNACHIWNQEKMNNISLGLSQDSYLDKRHKIYIKVFPSDQNKINTKVLVAGIVFGFLGLVLLCSIGVIFCRKAKSQGMLSEEDRKGLDVPFFEFKRILYATENFSLANKLGQGGFGPVYKGTFPGGVEIAVKRMASQSGQGLKEFKNEVLLIAKLQHRNLVKLLGYSMKDREMILLYEYMPNKSLDRFIFADRTPCVHLDWALRFDIIMGIARGLLYLHQDSRLRIIHRDLKASNVLLDENMNPKISDFGLAKIVKGMDTEASTTRVIGTYGYMAPEYALNGLFSIKSDVFSFGVILLEIISGKKNTGYYRNQQAFSLVSFAWGLWKEKRPLDLLDPTLAESCNSIEVLRCMIVGLLCIQEDPQDRPTMTNVLFMLGMDVESLPDPKEPAFVSKTHVHSSASYVSESEIAQFTMTELEGR